MEVIGGIVLVYILIKQASPSDYEGDDCVPNEPETRKNDHFDTFGLF